MGIKGASWQFFVFTVIEQLTCPLDVVESEGKEKSMRDTIVDEVRKAREDYARQFDFDLDAICRDLRQKQEESGVKVVSLPPRRPTPLGKTNLRDQ